MQLQLPALFRSLVVVVDAFKAVLLRVTLVNVVNGRHVSV